MKICDENSSKSERLNRNLENTVARLCSEPQKGELARESEKLGNLYSSLCPLVYTNETEKMSSNSRESNNLDQTEENSDVPGHTGDYLGTSKKSEQPSKRPIELVKTGEFISQQKNQKGPVENSENLSLNQENSRNCSIKKNSVMHSEAPHVSKANSEVQFEEIRLNDDDDDLLRKNLQLKNKLVESCPQTHLDGFQTARQRKNEMLSDSCPETTRGHIPLAEKEENEKVVRFVSRDNSWTHSAR